MPCVLCGPVVAQTPAPARAPAPPPTLVKVRDDVFIIQNVNHVVADIGQNGGNATVLVTSDGVILVDTRNDRVHDDLIAKVKSLTDKPAIVNYGDGGSWTDLGRPLDEVATLDFDTLGAPGPPRATSRAWRRSFGREDP